MSVSRTSPTAPNKVEEYAKKLRADMEASERVLNVFIKTIQDKHINAQNNLKRANENLSNIKKLIVKYKNEIANATKYEDKYQTDETAQSKQSSLLSSEYQKAKKMYEDEAANIKFEKQFLEEIIKYIQLRKSNCQAK
jgi:DNA repair ATPase RecN